jgi:hypothetical protein
MGWNNRADIGGEYWHWSSVPNQSEETPLPSNLVKPYLEPGSVIPLRLDPLGISRLPFSEISNGVQGVLGVFLGMESDWTEPSSGTPFRRARSSDGMVSSHHPELIFLFSW